MLSSHFGKSKMSEMNSMIYLNLNLHLHTHRRLVIRNRRLVKVQFGFLMLHMAQ